MEINIKPDSWEVFEATFSPLTRDDMVEVNFFFEKNMCDINRKMFNRFIHKNDLQKWREITTDVWEKWEKQVADSKIVRYELVQNQGFCKWSCTEDLYCR